jgi:hypothetical protein
MVAADYTLGTSRAPVASTSDETDGLGLKIQQRRTGADLGAKLSGAGQSLSTCCTPGSTRNVLMSAPGHTTRHTPALEQLTTLSCSNHDAVSLGASPIRRYRRAHHPPGPGRHRPPRSATKRVLVMRGHGLIVTGETVPGYSAPRSPWSGAGSPVVAFAGNLCDVPEMATSLPKYRDDHLAMLGLPRGGAARRAHSRMPGSGDHA